MFSSLAFIAAAVASLQGVLAVAPTGTQQINLWKLKQQQHSLSSRAVQDTKSTSDFPVYNFTQPLDHFSNDSTATFQQRYWLNTRHYKPGSGGPVVLVDGGEGGGDFRIPIIDTGIVEILCRAAGGIGLVLEHRYYGKQLFRVS